MSGGTVPAGRKAGGCLTAPRRGEPPPRRGGGIASKFKNIWFHGGGGYGDFSRGWQPYGENQLMGDLGAFMEAWGSEGV